MSLGSSTRENFLIFSARQILNRQNLETSGSSPMQVVLCLARDYNLRGTSRRSSQMTAKDQVVIISGCRTPVGKFQGSLSDLSATQLGAIVVREAVKRAGVDPAQVDECIMGNVVSAGLG